MGRCEAQLCSGKLIATTQQAALVSIHSTLYVAACVISIGVTLRGYLTLQKVGRE